MLSDIVLAQTQPSGDNTTGAAVATVAVAAITVAVTVITRIRAFYNLHEQSVQTAKVQQHSLKYHSSRTIASGTLAGLFHIIATLALSAQECELYCHFHSTPCLIFCNYSL